MYLPLAAVLAAVVTAASVAGRWLLERGTISGRSLPVAGGCLAIGVSWGFGILTFQRNQDYQSEVLIWQDTVAKAPNNVRAHNEFGRALTKSERFGEAIAEYQKAAKLDPQYVYAHINLANEFTKSGRLDEAVDHFQQAVRLRPAPPSCVAVWAVSWSSPDGSMKGSTTCKRRWRSSLTRPKREITWVMRWPGRSGYGPPSPSS